MAAALRSFTSTMVAWQLCMIFIAAIAGPAMASISLQNGAMPSRAGNRFLLDNPNPAAGGGRRSLLNYNACGTGSAPDYECKSKYPAYKNSTCCTQPDNSKQCYDVGVDLDTMCGSCNTKCSFGYTCCSGVCVNLQSDASNCGFCGNKCKSSTNLQCKSGMCGYGAAGKSA